MVRFPLFRTRAAAAGLALAASLSVAAPLASTTFAAAVPNCQFVLGFQTLHSLSASVTGDCTANQAFAANGDAQQATTFSTSRRARTWPRTTTTRPRP